MPRSCSNTFQTPAHPAYSRRQLLQAGGLGLLGLSLANVAELRSAAGSPRSTGRRSKSVIYIFLTGGLAQHESFDMKPDVAGGNSWRIRADRDSVAGSVHLRTSTASGGAQRQVERVSFGLAQLERTHSGDVSDALGTQRLAARLHKQAPNDGFSGLAAIAGRMISDRSYLPGSAVLPYAIKTPSTGAGLMGTGTRSVDAQRCSGHGVVGRTAELVRPPASTEIPDEREHFLRRRVWTWPTA